MTMQIKIIVVDDIVIYGYYNYDILLTSGEYHRAIWTSNHVVMASHKCGLGLEHMLFM
jgi:hypothetical protein